MTSIVFTAEGADAQAEVNGKLTAGMVGVRIRFELDEAWKGLNVIATFEGSGALISVPLLSYMEGAVPLNVQAYRVIDTDVPWEVLQKANTRLRIGLEGRLNDGTIVIPTVWARAGYIEAGALATGEEANQPTPGIYDQIMAAIEDGKLKGERGDPGEQGPAGPAGPTGATGPAGPQGEKGETPAIADDLYTKDSTKALSANMGVALREKIDNDLLTVQKELESDIDRVEGSIPTETTLTTLITNTTEPRFQGLESDIKQRVKTVNGIAPDENGNVNVEVGTGGVAVETDPTVPAWAKQPTKPTYTASEVGALPDSTVIPTVPSALKNPHALTFTGAVEATYDGSGPVSVVIPQPGSGGSGEPGADGFSPVATVTQTGSGAVISITDKSGTTTAAVFNGKDGKDGYTPVKGVDYFDGEPGKDGVDGKDGAQGIQGEKGPKGDTGAPGADGANGKDGVSATHSWNGTTLTITSASGTSSANLKGDKGDKGDQGIQGIQGEKGDTGAPGSNGTNGKDGANGTSVTVKSVSESTADGGSNVVTFSDGKILSVKNGSKGSTGATGAQGIQGVKGDKGDTGATGATGPAGKDGKDGLDATPVTPLFANSVEECTDTSKFYVLPDGFIYAYQYVEATGPSYTNLAGTITYDRRLSSSGKASSSAMSGACYTGFIPVKQGQVVRVKNLDMYTDFSSSAFPYVCFYTGASESNVVSSTPYVRPADLKTEFNGVANSASGNLVTWTAFKIQGGAQHSLASSITHIRISGKYFADKEVIVTVDEEITEGGSTGGYKWVNTGHAFVPADYEAEILALQKNKADKTAIPTKLPNPNALTIDGVKYDGSSAVNIETQSGGNILYGKKWVACGDSFTHGGYNASDGFDSSVYVYQDGRFAGKNIVYPYIIGLRNNMNIVNLATGGQTMAQSSNSFMSRYANIDADADYITIMLGINDKVQGLAVGTLEDSVNTTFCGAFNIAMEHILENHPFAHVGIMVSHGTNEEIMEATRGIAERWGVPYLDYGSPQVPLMNRYTGRNVCAKAQEIREKNFCVISDGTTPTNGHPNTAAHEYESTFIEAWLRTL